MGVIIPGDFKVVRIKRYFALNVFVLTRFHCIPDPVAAGKAVLQGRQVPDTGPGGEEATGWGGLGLH